MVRRSATCILTPALPGDANLDGTVDINDLTIVLAHYGQTGMTWGQGEFTGDGTVDINDLTIVLANYNKSAGASAGMAAVPEPSCLVLLGIGGVGWLACWAETQAKIGMMIWCCEAIKCRVPMYPAHSVCRFCPAAHGVCRIQLP